MSISIIPNAPTFSKTQLHALICGNYKGATTLSGWDSFKNFFTKMLNHIPGVCLADKEKFLKNTYHDLHGNDLNGTHHAEGRDGNVVISALDKLMRLMHKDDIKYLALYVEDTGLLHSLDIPICDRSRDETSPLKLLINIHGHELDPIYIENSDDSRNKTIAFVSNHMSKSSMPETTYLNPEYFDLSNVAHSSESYLNHIPTLIDEVISKQHHGTLTTDECTAHIIYLNSLMHSTDDITDAMRDFIYKLTTALQHFHESNNTIDILKEIKKELSNNSLSASHTNLYVPKHSVIEHSFSLNDINYRHPDQDNSGVAAKRNKFESNIRDFKRELQEELSSLNNLLQENVTFDKEGLKSLNTLLTSLSNKIAITPPYLSCTLSSPEIRNEISLALISCNELKINNDVKSNDDLIYGTINKSMNDFSRNLKNMRKNFDTILSRYGIDSDFSIQRAYSRSIESVNLESTHSLYIIPVEEVIIPAIHSDGDSGLNSSVSHSSSMNDSSSFHSFNTMDEREDIVFQSRWGDEKQRSTALTGFTGTKRKNVRSRKGVFSTIASKIKQPFEHIKDVDQRRTALQQTATAALRS